MATMRQIRSRIRVAKNIQQITKAMKMVAAARLRRAQEAVSAARPYANSLKEVMQSLGASGGKGVATHPLMREAEANPQKVGILLVAGERGLCGSFNSNAIRQANELLRGLPVDQARIVSVGRRGAAFFRRRGYNIVAEHPLLATGTSFAQAQAIAKDATALFESGEVSILYLVYTRFFSAMTQKVQAIQLFPIQPPEGETPSAQASTEPIYEPSAEEILADLLPRYVDTLVYQAIIESTASFFGAQMTSMSAATDNAGKMISGLTLSLNRARQATITKEISEIVGGADALK